MDRTELVALRDAIDTILAWPESVRDQVARWIAPNGALADETVSENNGAKYSPAPNGAPRPNGHDRRPPRQAKARPQNKFNTRTAELKLLEALQRSAGSVSALAKAAGASKSSTGERLRGLASRGVVTKDSAGHWRLVAELAGAAPDPTSPPSAS